MTTHFQDRAEQLLTSVTSGGTNLTSDEFLMPPGNQGNFVFAADISGGSGTVSATVTFNGSIDGAHQYPLATINLSGGSGSAQGSATVANQPWPEINAVANGITSGATVNAWAAAR